MNAMSAAHAQRILEFESTALAGFTQLLNVLQNNVNCLGDLIRQSRITQIRRGHTIVNPTAWGLPTFRNVFIDAFSHVCGERNNIVIGNLFNFVDALNREVRMIANPLGFFLGDARLTQFSLSFACQHFDFFPNFELVLKLPDSAHFRTRITTNHVVSFLLADS